MKTDEAFEGDEGLPSERAKANAAKAAVRDQAIALFAFRRDNGQSLADVAIAARLGLKPSEVTAIRAEYAQAQRLATLATPDGPIRKVEEPRKDAAAVYAVCLSHLDGEKLLAILADARLRLRLAEGAANDELAGAARLAIDAAVTEMEARGLPVPPDEILGTGPAGTPAKPKRQRRKKGEPVTTLGPPEAAWLMTPDEFVADLLGTPEAGGQTAEELRARHRTIIEGCLADGRKGEWAPTARVLAEYPDLVAPPEGPIPARCDDCNGVGGHWGLHGRKGMGRCPTCGLAAVGQPEDAAPEKPKLARKGRAKKAEPAQVVGAGRAIDRGTFLIDLLAGHDVSREGRALASAGLHTVGDLLDLAARGDRLVRSDGSDGRGEAQLVYAALRGVAGLSAARVLEIGDAVANSGLVAMAGEADKLPRPAPDLGKCLLCSRAAFSVCAGSTKCCGQAFCDECYARHICTEVVRGLKHQELTHAGRLMACKEREAVEAVADSTPEDWIPADAPGVPAATETPQVTTREVLVKPVMDAAERRAVTARDFLLWTLGGWESAALREPGLTPLVEMVRATRLFAERRLAGAPSPELEGLDGAAAVNGLLLKLWAWEEEAVAHPALAGLAAYVRALRLAREQRGADHAD